ncbi:hypothetical protein BDZ89DRAFT_1172761 [Hymenopellis radicata]|nr:hypothetical protein BDZ89DRAFT_1172761 [Hymenopellis radicata]
MPPFSIRDSVTFPTYDELPHEYGYDLSYYSLYPNGVLRPRRHWALLAEITDDLTLPLPAGQVFRIGAFGSSAGHFATPYFAAKDMSGTPLNISFKLDMFEEAQFHSSIKKKCVPGHTIVKYWAEQHDFLDMSSGLRIESLRGVDVLACSLKTLLSADPEAVLNSRRCQNCDTATADAKCSRCHCAWYCNRDCQTAHWKDHKEMCIALAQVRSVRKWSKKDWHSFKGWWQDVGAI